MDDLLQVQPLRRREIPFVPFCVPPWADQCVSLLSREMVEERDHLAVVIQDLRVGQQRPALHYRTHEAGRPRQPVIGLPR